jgi:hypothetical protein
MRLLHLFRSFIKGSSVTEDPYAHRFLTWIKARLDEMNATLTLIDKSAGTLEAGAKKQAEEQAKKDALIKKLSKSSA